MSDQSPGVGELAPFLPTQKKGKGAKKPRAGSDPAKVQAVERLFRSVPKGLSSSSDETQVRVSTIQALERILKKDITTRHELEEYVTAYVGNLDGRRSSLKERVKRARKRLQLSQLALAHQLGYRNHTTIAQVERGCRIPTRRILEWLETTETSQKRSRTGAPEKHSVHIPPQEIEGGQ